MRKRDTSDVKDSLVAVAADALAMLVGFFLATWIRFDSGWLPVPLGRHPHIYHHYAGGILLVTLAYLLIFRSLGLYVRPQIGRFEDKIPRLARASGLGLVAAMVMAFISKNYVEYSTLAIFISLPTVALLVVLERYICFRLELHYARHSSVINRVLILGTDSVAAHLKRSLENEPKLRSRVVGFLRTDLSEPDEGLPQDLIGGTVDELAAVALSEEKVDQIILTNSTIGHQRIVDIILFCEREMIRFNMVPDLFRILTGSMDMQSVDDIPMLGISQWPLDHFWKRVLKRGEDLLGASVGLLLSAPLIAVAALLIKRESPGAVFYSQERCGEKGKPFHIYKLRTMRLDAEAQSGPVFTAEQDPRVLRIGGVLRRLNLDELPQFWNVLCGDMSLVGPRPERPHFVEKFKEDIGRYMWRHVSKPGVTGWAQINGLRGNTSIEERIKYDLYYLENWSLALDFKILVKTFMARENAY
ncbi:MAG: exopolysaccharide biosynthesis polyprenyl glycosylphosphotransferase [Verrucomicrobia bacterium]|jgi:exopolysaccharide biosynthesis polyprenyl glycosylphosphotransferase|nr:exopolysaccharide biosynthesis polyprenyl glycosylphosphotransferase [Verrucomicrobiota bacterium]MBT7068061.1 exopolysaccharide biosynthesis polyprenyl glycosylphosphotransferase [Verrucomicrobiota bacterium]MBT7699078.1 exopolysaccharide biosynthesis polyprenyl glycosylphosphotransferase [Verrucomicrobiota bacterium]